MHNMIWASVLILFIVTTSVWAAGTPNKPQQEQLQRERHKLELQQAKREHEKAQQHNKQFGNPKLPTK